MSYKNYHKYNLALASSNNKCDMCDVAKGFLLFIFLLLLTIGPLLMNKSLSFAHGDNTTLFSCIEYDESYMTCSLGSIR